MITRFIDGNSIDNMYMCSYCKHKTELLHSSNIASYVYIQFNHTLYCISSPFSVSNQRSNIMMSSDVITIIFDLIKLKCRPKRKCRDHGVYKQIVVESRCMCVYTISV